MNAVLYVPGRSWLHRVPAGAKLLALAVAGAMLLNVHSLVWLGVAVGVAAFLVRSCGVGAQALWRQLRGLLWFMLALGLYTAWIQSPDAAAEMILRLAALVLAALAVTFSTPLTSMMAVVEWLVMPLGKLGWADPQRIALAFGLTLRMIPELTVQWQEIREAQAARGIPAHAVRLIVPMLVRTVRRAGEIAEAIDARGA
jgi:biotin transport system permease protein